MDSQDVKDFFERVSGDWDQMHQSFYSEEVIEALAEHSDLHQHSVVVDVGTGTGFIAGGLAPRVARVIGTDSSPGMLAQATANLTALGANNVELVEARVDSLPLGDRTVDAAVANMVLHHAPDPAAMIAEMARVVRPGGSVAITDCVEHEYEWMRTEQADLWLGFSLDTIAGLFCHAGLVEHGYASLGTA